jgi:GTP-binding protein HflX
MAKANAPAVFISAGKNENINELRAKLMEMVKEKHFQLYPNFNQ